MPYFTHDIIALACAADRMNGGYVKSIEYGTNAEGFLDYNVVVRRPNKELMSNWLKDSNWSCVTAADRERAEGVMAHYRTYTMLMLTKPLTDFQKTALKVASSEHIEDRDRYSIAIAACLPSTADREKSMNERKREVAWSTPLDAAEGSKVEYDVLILSSKVISKPEFTSNRVDAKVGDSFVYWWSNSDMSEYAGQVIRIKGRIKAHKADKTTQLNYVKKV